jgi:hypothetical protein
LPGTTLHRIAFTQQSSRILTPPMGWKPELGAGPVAIRLSFCRTGAFCWHVDRGAGADERFRLSGRHFRLVIARHERPPQAGCLS